MNAQNFRLGNRVFVEISRRRLVEVKINRLVVGEGGYIPIPLNDVIIQDMGFWWDIDGYYDGLFRYCIMRLRDCYALCSYDDGQINYIASAEYVHELQNLWFCLTNEEI